MQKRKFIISIFSCAAMLIIILDGKTAVSSIKDGIDICMQTAIPALFPFFVHSKLLNSCFFGKKFRIMSPLRRICRIPEGSESILLIGILSGYPVGAQLITDAYTTGMLSEKDAKRMLGFCSNAGPAFIFGMLATAFDNALIPWVLWAVHIVSAIAVGYILPGGTTEKCTIKEASITPITEVLQKAMKSMAVVCGWIILFRFILDFLKKWILWVLPSEFQVIISGFIELANGSISLNDISCDSHRFVISTAILAFGGLCVVMQTKSVTKDLGVGTYFPGKLLQTLLSITISATLLPILFPDCCNGFLPKGVVILVFVIALLVIFLLHRKKVVAFPGSMLYNSGKERF